jgi:predicted flap endonuclease-1-like 5' DNA nuclease
MTPEIANALPMLIFAVLVLAAVAIWLLVRANRKAKVIDENTNSLKRDVLDEGAARAARNQALIDAQPASVKPAASPAPVPAPAPASTPIPAAAPAPAAAAADDLTRIKGLGPKLAALLHDQGVTSFAQIAAWSDTDVAKIDDQLGRFKGRITRDQWVAQAQLLAAGDEAGFTAQFGNNG